MGFLKRLMKGRGPEMYTEEEFDAVENHIDRCFGHVENVFHELVSPDIHVDIEVVEPAPGRNFYTLVTVGMGAHRMKMPRDLRGCDLERAELLICLPPDWNIESDEERWYWPLRWLKIMARIPIEERSWVGYGHTASDGEKFAENTGFTAVMAVMPDAFGEDSRCCEMPDGGEVNFFQLVPLFDDELNLKSATCAEDLEDLFKKKGVGHVVDIARRSVCRV
ncbi:MAG: suppressor of fused domain protein [Candidatus Methanoplasma sp.]|jgi:hypothetical protein|nr:suppressor of fused domain protein [Candidatus Methanoplasma sp.]